MHVKILKFHFGFPSWVERTEMATEFRNKFRVIGKPGDIISGGQGGFKPVQHSAFEIGQCVGNLGTVISKRIGTVSEVKEALSQEGL